MDNKTAFGRGVITSTGYIFLIVVLAIHLSSFYLLILIPFIPFTMWREKKNHFNNANIDKQIDEIKQSLTEIKDEINKI